MSIRAKTSHQRCGVCRLHLPICICAQSPRLLNQTRLVIFMHRAEQFKTTNTGRLAAHCLADSQILIHGDFNTRLTPDLWLQPDRQPLFLFPGEDALPIERFAGRSDLTLLVPDGTWRQAAKMHKRISGLKDIPKVTLPPGPPSRYGLRVSDRKDGLATMEAIARALGALEGAEIETALNDVFTLMVDRILWMKGRKSADQVKGGIPVKYR